MPRKFARLVGMFLIVSAAVMFLSCLPLYFPSLTFPKLGFIILQLATAVCLGMVGVTIAWNSYHDPYLLDSDKDLPAGDYQILSRQRRPPFSQGGPSNYYYVVAQVFENELGDKRWIIHRHNSIDSDTFEIRYPAVIPGGLFFVYKPKLPAQSP